MAEKEVFTVGERPRKAPKAPKDWVIITHDSFEKDENGDTPTTAVAPKAVPFWTEVCGWRVVHDPNASGESAASPGTAPADAGPAGPVATSQETRAGRKAAAPKEGE